ncbi:MAG: rane protein insertion efficiency factor YidD [Pseudomonadota bacterium]|jgi:putative membrane protein insertion efficiency factor
MLTRALLAMIALYQRWVSPLLGDCCRFEPSCSRYASLCIRHYGPLGGARLALLRLLRCNPFFSGGVDLPPLPPGAPLTDVEVDWTRIARQVAACCELHAAYARPVRSPVERRSL